MLRVAIQDTFLQSFAKLPRTEQKRAQQMIEKLQENSRSSALNFERYEEAVDPKIHSVRVSDVYRAIVVKPERGNVVLLVWVDHHDEAYRWVKRKRFEANSVTGVLQMWSTEEAPSSFGSSSAMNVPDVETGIFASYTDKQLMKLGVPALLLPLVRSVQTSDELDRYAGQISPEAKEALSFLATGEPYDEVLAFMSELWDEERRESGLAEGDIVEELDAFDRAVLHPNASRHIVIVTSDKQLEEILAQPLDRWRTFLHPSQKALVEGKFRGSIRVLGGAGTGKTVVALHRVRFLVQHVLGAKDRVLLTTFTVNLAETIKETLRTMCSATEMERIDVISIDRLAKQIVERSDERIQIEYDQRDFDPLWLQALQTIGWSFDRLSFVKQEYERVILQNGAESWEEYLDTPRTGRSVRISRVERRQVWSVVESFRAQMRDMKIYGPIDVLHLARKWVEANRGVISYRAAVVDEGQDLHPEAYKLLRALVAPTSNDLFIVGDAHQRIYPRRVVLGRCGIEIRGQRSKRLRVNYRTTEQIRQRAVHVLQGLDFDDLNGGQDTGTDISLLSGTAPERLHFVNPRQQESFVLAQIRELLATGFASSEIAILARTNGIVDQYSNFLKAEHIPVVKMAQEVLDRSEGIRVGTMHRSKGLEFRAVLLVDVNEGVVPPAVRMRADSVEEKKDVEREERSLLYVASTRAREILFVTSCGLSSPYWPTH